MIKVKQLAHVCIFAHDLEATRSFYRDVLGLDTQFNFLRDGEVFGFYLNCGGRSHVEVFQKDGTTYSEQNQINHFCLEVENIDAAIAHIKSKGIDVTAFYFKTSEDLTKHEPRQRERSKLIRYLR